VITPSRLATNPAGSGQNLYLDHALSMAKNQTADVPLEFVVGLDRPPSMMTWAYRSLFRRKHLPKRFKDVRGAYGKGGQAAAVNAAVKASTGEVIALLEDDDFWDPYKLSMQLPRLDDFDLVTCNQREIDTHGNFLRYNNFATPSGWVMRRETWDKVGGFYEGFRYHVDTEWLGRAHKAGVKRIHLVQEGVVADAWLAQVQQRSAIATTDGITEPLVHRFVHEGSGMAKIRTDHEARLRSADEHALMFARFGEVPW
jgi:hypothetical protein